MLPIEKQNISKSNGNTSRLITTSRFRTKLNLAVKSTQCPKPRRYRWYDWGPIILTTVNFLLTRKSSQNSKVLWPVYCLVCCWVLYGSWAWRGWSMAGLYGSWWQEIPVLLPHTWRRIVLDWWVGKMHDFWSKWDWGDWIYWRDIFSWQRKNLYEDGICV